MADFACRARGELGTRRVTPPSLPWKEVSMSRDIDPNTPLSELSRRDKHYLLQRPWMTDAEMRQELIEALEEPEPYKDMTDREIRIELKRLDADYSKAPRSELVERLAEAETANVDEDDSEE